MSQPHQDGWEIYDYDEETDEWEIVDVAFDVFEHHDEEVAVVGTPPQGAAGPGDSQNPGVSQQQPGPGVSQASIDQLPSYQCTAEEAAARNEQVFTCSICLGVVEPGQKVRVLTCEHQFHAPCVDQWLLGNRTCPICRSVVQG